MLYIVMLALQLIPHTYGTVHVEIILYIVMFALQLIPYIWYCSCRDNTIYCYVRLAVNIIHMVLFM